MGCFLIFSIHFSIPEILDSFQSTRRFCSKECCANLGLSSWPSKLRQCTSSKHLYICTI